MDATFGAGCAPIGRSRAGGARNQAEGHDSFVGFHAVHHPRPRGADLLPAELPLFVLGHDYDAWGLASVGVFAAVTTWLTWRTGGLEAAVALHAVNNTIAFALGAIGIADLNATTTTWVAALMSSIIPIGFAVVFDVWWRRRGCRLYSSVSATSPRAMAAFRQPRIDLRRFPTTARPSR